MAPVKTSEYEWRTGGLTLLRYFGNNRKMSIDNAISAFGALAHPHRLNAFRLLVRHGPDGLPAGRIAEHLLVPASTLSTHLAQLERSALLHFWRVGQRIFYAIDVDGTA